MRSPLTRQVFKLGFIGLLATSFIGCGGEDVKYTPRPAYTGEKANLPSVANVPTTAIKNGDAYTVWGAGYHLRSRVHRRTVANKDIKITGYIVKTNLPDAPECAVHETGKEDPEGCIAPVPTFWIADSPDADLKDSIKVMGWASNFAQIYDAIREYRKRERARKQDADPLMDAFWGVKIPNPIPVKGAKVTVQGNYSTTFTKATTGAEADPVMGILTYDSVEYDETPEEKATLPGMR